MDTGTDHAGIATQTKVEKQLKEKTGKTKHDIGRDQFIEEIWNFRESSGETILNQLKKLGASCDWSRTSFTLDKIILKQLFLHLLLFIKGV